MNTGSRSDRSEKASTNRKSSKATGAGREMGARSASKKAVSATAKPVAKKTAVAVTKKTVITKPPLKKMVRAKPVAKKPAAVVAKKTVLVNPAVKKPAAKVVVKKTAMAPAKRAAIKRSYTSAHGPDRGDIPPVRKK